MEIAIAVFQDFKKLLEKRGFSKWLFVLDFYLEKF